MRRLLVPLLLALSLGFSLGGCGWAGRHDEKSKPDGFLLQGYVSVAGAAAGITGSACLAPSTVPDVYQGGSVRIADGSGHPIAAAELNAGVLAPDGTSFDCNFAFEARNVSGSRAAYQLSVGDRPALTFQTKDLAEGRPAVIPVATATASTSPS
ncbi:hypothetical protein ACQP00_05400 [Dactylosporangium sp. CS-047395]|uniref:hypothetical protein n=1 Tax=Dactylosporangium sp. CS-047395 TaxID=3239936 RepID=UPI003D8BD161